MRMFHGLSSSRSFLALAVLLLGGLVFAGLAGAGFRHMISIERAQGEAALRNISWPVDRQPGAEGGENAAIYYKRAAALAVAMTGDQRERLPQILRNGWKDPDGSWAALLDRNREALEMFGHAARMPFCDFTEGRLDSLRSDTPVPLHEYELELSRLLLLEARSHEAGERPGRAVADYTTVVLAARHMAQQKNFMQAHSLVYSMMLDMAWEPIARFEESDLGSASDYQRLFSALAFLKDGKPGPGEVERESAKMTAALNAGTMGVIGRQFRAGVRDRAVDDQKELFAQAVERRVLAADRNEPEIYGRFLDSLKKDNPAVFPDGRPSMAYCLAHPDTIGRCWTMVNLAMQPDPGNDVVLHYVAQARLNLLETGTAVRLYEIGRGGPPPALGALVPEYLSTAPADPFDGFGPLHYALAPDGSWVLYSLGPDRKDDRGEAAYAAEDISDWKNPPPGDLILRGSSRGTH